MERFQNHYQISILKIITNKKLGCIKKNIFYRYLIAGVINTFFGFSVLTLLSLTKIETWKIIFLANLLGVTFNYFSYSEFAFKNYKKNIKNYIFVYFFIYLLQLMIITIVTSLLQERIYGVLASLPFTVIANYYLFKKFVYKKDYA